MSTHDPDGPAGPERTNALPDEIPPTTRLTTGVRGVIGNALEGLAGRATVKRLRAQNARLLAARNQAVRELDGARAEVDRLLALSALQVRAIETAPCDADVLALTVRAEQAETALEAVRRLHRRDPDAPSVNGKPQVQCAHDGDPWPCPTYLAARSPVPVSRRPGIQAAPTGQRVRIRYSRPGSTEPADHDRTTEG